MKKLETDFKRIEGDVAKVRVEVGRVESEVRKGIEHERGERRAEDQKIGEQLETATIGGIRLEVAGVAYLFVGIAFTSIPGEVASVLRGLGM